VFKESTTVGVMHCLCGWPDAQPIAVRGDDAHEQFAHMG